MFKSLDPKLTLKKSHAEFRSLKNFQKALNNVTLNYQVLHATSFSFSLQILHWLTDLMTGKRRHYQKSSDCFGNPKIFPHKSNPKKQSCDLIFPPTIINWNRKPKNIGFFGIQSSTIVLCRKYMDFTLKWVRWHDCQTHSKYLTTWYECTIPFLLVFKLVWFNSCKVIRIPASKNFCLWNLEYSSRIPESRLWLESGIQVPLTRNPDSTA